MRRHKGLWQEFLDSPDFRAKIYLLITIGQIWAVIAIVIGVIFFIYLLMREIGVLIV